jgi:hypothetical protein
MTADWQIYPTQPWNYALATDTISAGEVIVGESAIGSLPFSAKQSPVAMRVKARKLPDWRAEDGAANPVPQSPVKSDEPLEKITLIPYAAAKLRITAFPQLQEEATTHANPT